MEAWQVEIGARALAEYQAHLSWNIIGDELRDAHRRTVRIILAAIENDRTRVKALADEIESRRLKFADVASGTYEMLSAEEHEVIVQALREPAKEDQ